jgi:hypothetical protein
MYIDGALVAESAYTAALDAPVRSGQIAALGKDGINSRYYFNGYLDEVRVWSTARTQTEIQDNMNRELNGSESGLLLYYNMNEGSGSLVSDKTSNDNNGTCSPGIISTNWTTSAPTLTESSTPITLNSFTAKASKANVLLNWISESETENSHFIVYRNDKLIASVAGAGSTSERHEYEFVDNNVNPGTHTYSISDVSYGGVEKHHDALSVEIGSNISEVNFILNKAYPNPFNPRTAISYHLFVTSKIDLSIYNTQGVLVEALVNGQQEAGQHKINWDASNMSSGVYIVKMIAGDAVSSEKLLLVK